MKLVAKVHEVLKSGVHGIGTIMEGEVVHERDLPLPDRVVIEVDESDDTCMMYRYTNAGNFCGDTWHEDLDSAILQANYEYGLSTDDFVEVLDDGVSGR
jgi:hypothetical protein